MVARICDHSRVSNHGNRYFYVAIGVSPILLIACAIALASELM
jgi:hypothetical protein